MDSNKYFQIRDVRSSDVIGYKERKGDFIFVPETGQVENFIVHYNALNNFDMGMAVELFDEVTTKVDHFALLYAFKECDKLTSSLNREYRILEVPLTNLDILELIYQYNKNCEKNKI